MRTSDDCAVFEGFELEVLNYRPRRPRVCCLRARPQRLWPTYSPDSPGAAKPAHATTRARTCSHSQLREPRARSVWSCADLDRQCDHPVHYGGSMCAIAGLHESIPAQLGDLRCATRIEVMCASAPPRTTVQTQSSPIFLEFYSKRHSYLRSHCGCVLTMVVSTVEV